MCGTFHFSWHRFLEYLIMPNLQSSLRVMLLLSVLLPAIDSKSQPGNTFTGMNTVYVEGISRSPYYSLNYDGVFKESYRYIYTFRVGAAFTGDAAALPLALNMLTQGSSSHAELSLTFTPYINNLQAPADDVHGSDKQMYISTTIGYRYQKAEGGLFFKAAGGPELLIDPSSDPRFKRGPELNLVGNVGLGISF
jgi:hypothetical protein